MMRTLMAYTVGTMVVVIVVACGVTPVEPLDPPGDANGKPTFATLQTGAAIHEKYCGQCHAHARPEEHTDEEWKPIVRRMAGHAKLTPEQAGQLLAWLRWANDPRPAMEQGAGK